MVFSVSGAVAMIRKERLGESLSESGSFQPLAASGQRVGAVPGRRAASFGLDFYEEQTPAELIRQTPENWKIRLEGRMCSTGRSLRVTPYEELEAFIREELGDLFWKEDVHGEE